MQRCHYLLIFEGDKLIKLSIDPRRLSIKSVALSLVMMALATGCTKAKDSKPVEHRADEIFVGMCFNDASPEDTEVNEDAGSSITNLAIESLACDAAHDNEVYYIHALPATAQARLETPEFFEDMLDICEDEFKDYIGKEYQKSFYEMSVLFPTSESWEQGHKQAICYAFHPEADKLDYPLKGIKK